MSSGFSSPHASPGKQIRYILGWGKLMNLAAGFFRLAGWLADMERQSRGEMAASEVTDRDKQMCIESLGNIGLECKDFHLKVSAAYVGRMLEILQTPDDLKVPRPRLTYGRFGEIFTHLRDTIEDELGLGTFLHIPEELAVYLQRDLFGPEVTTKFPSGVFDIAESGACLAVGRGTSAVFHLMRVMELGLNAVARALDCSPHLPSWDAKLKKIEDALTGVKQSSLAAERVRFFSEVLVRWRAVQTAWLNPTMHVEKKYTLGEARETFSTARSFMRHLATQLGED
jgi:hypothetical protein